MSGKKKESVGVSDIGWLREQVQRAESKIDAKEQKLEQLIETNADQRLIDLATTSLDDARTSLAYLQKDKEKYQDLLASAQEAAQGASAAALKTQGKPDVSQWEWDDHLNRPILESGQYLRADEAATEVKSYILGLLNLGEGEQKDKDRKFAVTDFVGRGGPQSMIFAHRGLMGMGKTRLHNELCEGGTLDVPSKLRSFGVTAKFIRITYNEQSEIPDSLKGASHATFVQQLLWFHGLKEEEAKKVTGLSQGFELIWKKLNLSNTDILVVCVDELMKCPRSGADIEAVGQLIRDLAVHQDGTIFQEKPRRVIFLFSTVGKVMLDAARVASGRTPIQASVPKLTVKELNELFNASPGSKQVNRPMFDLLFQLCAGTPRYVLDGLPQAICMLPEKGVSAVALYKTIAAVLRASQSTSTIERDTGIMLHKLVQPLLRGGTLDVDDLEWLRSAGWLVDTDKLHPLVLRLWADRFDHPLAKQIKEMFEWDLEAGYSSEKRAEDVMIGFDQAKRWCYGSNGASVTLQDYYAGGSWHESDHLKSQSVTIKVSDVVYCDFSTVGIDQIKKYLRCGSIVVSTKGTEPGIEYLAPFHCDGNKQQVKLASVQVKFTGLDSVKNDVGRKMFGNDTVKKLDEDDDFDCFGVLYSTQHDNAADFGYTCSFNAESLEKWMRPVGPLRIHFEKSRKRALQSSESKLNKQPKH